MIDKIILLLSDTWKAPLYLLYVKLKKLVLLHYFLGFFSTFTNEGAGCTAGATTGAIGASFSS